MPTTLMRPDHVEPVNHHNMLNVNMPDPRIRNSLNKSILQSHMKSSPPKDSISPLS